MVHKIKNKSLYFLKRKESKKGELWSELADDRKHRQHPHGISDDDAHAIPKYESPSLSQSSSPEATEAAMHDLEEQIEILKDKQEPKKKAPEKKQDEYLDDWID